MALLVRGTKCSLCSQPDLGRKPSSALLAGSPGWQGSISEPLTCEMGAVTGASALSATRNHANQVAAVIRTLLVILPEEAALFRVRNHARGLGNILHKHLQLLIHLSSPTMAWQHPPGAVLRPMYLTSRHPPVRSVSSACQDPLLPGPEAAGYRLLEHSQIPENSKWKARRTG